MAKGTNSQQSGNPFDMSELMKLYDPERVAKMFDPSAFMAQMPSGMPDMATLMERNRRNYEAMVEANKAAAATYRDMLEKQTEIWTRMTEAAREYASEASGPDAMTKGSEAYAKAVETSLTLMQEMAETAREANEKAFADMQGRVNAAINDMKDG
jgi:hypothetical protein